MKTIHLLIIGLFISMIGYSQDSVIVRVSPSKLFPKTTMIISDGDDYIYEEYTYFKYVYWLNYSDTLRQINDSILSSDSLRINVSQFNTKFDFCDSTINKIRNSSLTHRLLHSMINDSCRKYIGLDNNELEKFRRDLEFEEGFDEKTCSDTFSVIAYEQFDSLINKIHEIYNRKQRRTKWIKSNLSKVDRIFIRDFLNDFNYKKPDNDAFIFLLIAKPEIVIEEIELIQDNYEIIWRVKEIKSNEWISKAIESIENTKVRNKIKRKILRKLRKTRANSGE